MGNKCNIHGVACVSVSLLWRLERVKLQTITTQRLLPPGNGSRCSLCNASELSRKF